MKSFLLKNNFLYKFSKMNFSVLPKATKMELTMRTPYRTFFENFNGFTRIYIGTLEGQIGIGNRTYPAIYLLPAGEIKVTALTAGKGNFSEESSGEFVHTGGYCMVHE